MNSVAVAYGFCGAAVCPSACGRSGSKQAQEGADFVQIIPAGLAMLGSSSVPTRTMI